MIERFLLILIVLLEGGRGEDPPKSQGICIKQDLRRITGDCTHSEAKMSLRLNSFSFQLKIDGKATLSQASIDISITVAKCELKGKTFSTPYGNLLSIEGQAFATTLTIQGDQKGLRLVDSTTNAILYNETCVPTIEQQDQRFILTFSWDLSDSTVDFSLPTSTSKSNSSDSNKLPTWAWIVISIVLVLLIICIIVLICVCIYVFCCKNRRKPTEKVDVGVPATEYGDYPASNPHFSDSRPSLAMSHLSIVSDFESFSGVNQGGEFSQSGGGGQAWGIREGRV